MSQELQENSEAEKRLGRYFSKLLGEAGYFQADSVEFVLEGENLAVALKKGGTAIKSNVMKKSWQPLIEGYLRRHSSAHNSDSQFTCKLLSNDHALYTKVSIEKRENNLHLIKLSAITPAIYQPSLNTRTGRGTGKIEVSDDFFLTQKKENDAEELKTSRRQILIVEDDADQRSIVEMVLKNEDYEVLLAADGEEALMVLAKNTPDLIITDLMMPNMDGYTFVKCLKESEREKNIPVLVLTVLGDEEREYKLLALGVDDYCEKTVQRKILLQRIENLLRRSK